MTRRDWWLGVAIVTAAILFHALVPRYDVRVLTGANHLPLRVDRWTGRTAWVRPSPPTDPPLAIEKVESLDDGKKLDALVAEYGGKPAQAPQNSAVSPAVVRFIGDVVGFVVFVGGLVIVFRRALRQP